MKNLKLGLAALILSLFYVVTPAQFLGPPSAYRDTTSVGDSAETIFQIGPPWSPVKLRSLNMARLAAEVNGSGGNGDFDTLNANVLSCDACYFNDTLLNLRDSTNKYVSSGIISNTAPGATDGLGFGWEYLYHIRDMWMRIFLGTSNTAPVIVLAGDSNMNGDGVQNQIFKPEYGIINAFVTAGFGKPDVRKMSVAGSNVKQWVLDTLPGQLAANPDVFILRAPLINGGPGVRDSAEYWIRRGLDSVRAHGKDMNNRTCIIEMTSATPDSAWYLSIQPWLRVVARDYQCVYIDTWTMWRDNAHGGDNWTDAGFHPTDVLSMAIVGQMADVIAPRGISQMMGNNVFTNMNIEAPISDVSTILPWARPVWPKGISMYSVTLPSAAQYPVDGAVLAFVSSNTKMMQLNFGPAGLGVRMGDTATGFGGWKFPLMANDTGLISVPKAFTSYQFTRSIKATNGVTVTGGLDADGLNVSGATTLSTLHATGNGTVDGSLTVKGVDGVIVSGPTATQAALYIQANGGATNADVWGHFVKPDGTYTLTNYGGGAHDVFTFTGSTSAASFLGTVNAAAYKVGGASGASCSGSAVTGITIVNGIVTACSVTP